MKTRVFAAAIAALVMPLLLVQPAQAKKKHHPAKRTTIVCNERGCSDRHAPPKIRTVDNRKRGARNCPYNLGCGCNLANYFHITGKQWRTLWVARNWKHEGSAAAKGCTGCVAVLSRGRGGHVGVVKDYDANGNPVIYSYANGRLGWTTTTYSARRVIAYRQL